MRKLIGSVVKRVAWRTGQWRNIYLRLCRPTAGEYTEFLRRHGGFHSIGEHCNILPTTVFTDPAYVKMGSNVHFSDCAIIGHDGSIAMLNRAYGLRLDSVGKVDIRDNVFIGFGAIVLPGVTIGPNAIVAAGAVVNRDVRAGDIVGGVPARPIGRTEDLATRARGQDREPSLERSDQEAWIGIRPGDGGGVGPTAGRVFLLRPRARYGQLAAI